MKATRTLGETLADPTSNLHRFVHVEAPQAMSHNPTSPAEWDSYFAYLREHPGCSTEAWRNA